MNELEKKIFNAWNISPDCAKKIAKIAIEEIKEAFRAGMDHSDGRNHYPDLEKYLKQKGYE